MNWATPMQYLRDHLKALKRVLYVLLAATIAFDFLVPEHEYHHFWQYPGFWTIFGFVGCVLLIRVMKGLAHTVLMKKEDYYG
jgi:hypothetical protein